MGRKIVKFMVVIALAQASAVFARGGGHGGGHSGGHGGHSGPNWPH
jgi:hypothetical protein